MGYYTNFDIYIRNFDDEEVMDYLDLKRNGKAMKLYLVFLDIDGVFTTNRVQLAHDPCYKMWARFDPVAIDFMNRIHEKYNVEFVISSTWKKYQDMNDIGLRHWIEATFSSSGFRGRIADKWKTIDTRYGERVQEIQQYLNERNGEWTDYIIFDDTDYGFNKKMSKKRFVQTDPKDGLLTRHMLNAKAMMGDWELKCSKQVER